MPLLAIEKNKEISDPNLCLYHRDHRSDETYNSRKDVEPQNMLHTIAVGSKTPEAHLWTLPMESKNLIKNK